MNEITRLKALAGQNANQESLKQLSADLKAVNENFDTAVDALLNGRQLDEGLLDALHAALQTAGQIGKAGVKSAGSAGLQAAKRAAAKAKKVSASVKTLYLDNKAQVELKKLLMGLGKLIQQFEDMQKKAPTIVSRDPDVAKELKHFDATFKSLIDTLSSRLVIKEGLSDYNEIHQALVEMELYDEEELLFEDKVDKDLMKEVMNTDEYKEAASLMKDITTKRHLANGTFMFDTGLAPKYRTRVSARYVLKIYADGQVRGELRYERSGKLKASSFNSHYRLGKPIKGVDELDMYRKALSDIVKRFKKKSGKYEEVQQKIEKLQQETEAKIRSLEFGEDAVEDDNPKD